MYRDSFCFNVLSLVLDIELRLNVWFGKGALIVLWTLNFVNLLFDPCYGSLQVLMMEVCGK